MKADIENSGSLGLAKIVGASDAIKQLFEVVRKVSGVDTTILVDGESGTGKELIAKALHYEGDRKDKPFVPVNCGAIPGELLESELFGHEKGAFTHAIRTRLGRFELANGGTVFLDEIAEMPPMLQVKLLRVLQEREFERVGSTQTIQSDFRVIAATNRDLELEVKDGRFREDLFYRLNVIPIHAPALRDRAVDIPLLVEHFIAKFNRLRNTIISGISEEAMGFLLRYQWPGNVRELENTIERMVILASGAELNVDDIPARIMDAKTINSHGVETIPEQGYYLNQVMASYEKQLLIQALNQTDWVKNRAAQLININRTTLIEKMKKFELVKPAVELKN